MSTILITGAGSGIGAGIAAELAKQSMCWSIMQAFSTSPGWKTFPWKNGNSSLPLCSPAPRA